MQPIGKPCSGPVSTRCSGNLPSHVSQRSCLPGVLRQRSHHASRMLQLPRQRQSRRRTGRCLQLHAEADPDSSSNQVQECADSPCMLSICQCSAAVACCAFCTASRGCGPSLMITFVLQKLESMKLQVEVRERVSTAVESLNGRVTVGDIAGRAGVSISEAEEALNALAADTQGTLEVSSLSGPLSLQSHLVVCMCWLRPPPLGDSTCCSAGSPVQAACDVSRLAEWLLLQDCPHCCLFLSGSKGGTCAGPCLHLQVSHTR